MAAGPRVDDSLQPWSELSAEFVGAGILIGNGSSRAVWDDFAYDSLYERARLAVDDPLSETDEDLFARLDTRNFETVLSALRTGLIVCDALAIDAEPIRQRYESIRIALMEAVQSVHVPWGDVPQTTLMTMRDELSGYSWIYSTNYDLLLYWAVMALDTAWPFKDYFWGACDVTGPWVCFHSDDTDASDEASKVLYLHGALHLCELPWEETAKLVAQDKNLLDQFSVPERDEEYPFVPLIVTEGSWQDKMAAIRRSDYLSFAFECFSAYQGPLVIFGHSLGDEDYHIVQALRQGDDQRPLAISIRAADESRIVERKLGFMQKLPHANIRFFDSATHPLGATGLRVD